jgi:hypothetical protein
MKGSGAKLYCFLRECALCNMTLRIIPSKFFLSFLTECKCSMFNVQCSMFNVHTYEYVPYIIQSGWDVF